jgi:[ribosomal protein S18]-alanine N-acetyltransferase
VQARYFQGKDVAEVYDIACTSLRENYNPTIFVELSPYWKEGFIVIEEMGQIVGFIFGIRVSQVEARVLMLAVRNELRGKGLGKFLMNQFIHECVNKGIRVISLEVRASNYPAKRFYDKLGFTTNGIIEKYYSDGENGIAMQLFL